MSIAKRKLKETFIGLCEIGLGLTVLFSVATAFDEWHQYLELFSHFRAQYFVVSVLLAVVFGALRWNKHFLAGLAMAALNAWFLYPAYYPAAEVEPGDGDFRIVHSNVLLTNTDATRFIEFIQSEQPDVVVMQEVTPAWLDAIESLNAAYPHRLAEAREDPFGIALYSKHPFEQSLVLASEPLGFPEIMATIVIAGKKLNLIASHPMQPIGADNFYARNLQLDSVAKIAARTPRPVVLIGDLNTTMWANHYRRLEETSGLQNARQGFGINPTWPLFMPLALIPIDHCLVSKDVVVTDFQTGPSIGSDHWPIVVSLSLEE